MGHLFPPQLILHDPHIPGVLFYTWVSDLKIYCNNNQVSEAEEYQILMTTPDLIPHTLRSQIAGLDSLKDCYSIMESNFPDEYGEMQVLLACIKGTELGL